MSDVRSWCQWWRTRYHHEHDNSSDKVNALLKIIWSYILTQNFWDNNNTDLPQNESNAWWCWISPKASVSLPILIKIMMIKKFMMMLTMIMLTMMTMMLTMMGPLSLIPNFSPNCSSRLSAYLDFNQQMPIVYRVKSWSGSPDQKRLLSPFLPGLSISDWGLFVHSRPGHIGRRQVLPCYVPAKIHCHQNWHACWTFIVLLALMKYPVAGSFKGWVRFFISGTSSSPSPEVSSRCSISLLPRASSISFLSSDTLEICCLWKQEIFILYLCTLGSGSSLSRVSRSAPTLEEK